LDLGVWNLEIKHPSPWFASVAQASSQSGLAFVAWIFPGAWLLGFWSFIVHGQLRPGLFKLATRCQFHRLADSVGFIIHTSSPSRASHHTFAKSQTSRYGIAENPKENGRFFAQNFELQTSNFELAPTRLQILRVGERYGIAENSKEIAHFFAPGTPRGSAKRTGAAPKDRPCGFPIHRKLGGRWLSSASGRVTPSLVLFWEKSVLCRLAGAPGRAQLHVHLLGPCGRRGRPVNGLVYHRAHLLEPPARARQPPLSPHRGTNPGRPVEPQLHLISFNHIEPLFFV